MAKQKLTDAMLTRVISDANKVAEKLLLNSAEDAPLRERLFEFLLIQVIGEDANAEVSE